MEIRVIQFVALFAILCGGHTVTCTQYSDPWFNWRKLVPFVHPCNLLNGGCEYKCTKVGKKAVCSCKDGYKLVDKEKCVYKELGCGKLAKDRQSQDAIFRRIANGGNVIHGDHPWQVSIRAAIFGFLGQNKCGGSLITKRHVLTAAHCLEGWSSKTNNFLQKMAHKVVNKEHVVLGEYDSDSNEGTEQKIGIAAVKIHKGYVHQKGTKEKRFFIKDDIAIITLSEDAKLTKHVNTICLPDAKESIKDDTCMITGWGETRKGEKHTKASAKVLQEVKVKITHHNLCKRLNRFNVIGKLIGPSSICVGLNDRNTKVACSGDSGGPMVCEAADHVWKLFGVTSYGSGNGCNGFSVYEDVRYYLPWIKKNI